MDLSRTPLLLEHSRHAAAGRKKPGGDYKRDRHRIRQKTSASMPTRPGAGVRAGRHLEGKLRMNQARDRRPGMSRRKAKRTRQEARPTVTSHTSRPRSNPQAGYRPKRRGNPNALAATTHRESSSLSRHRPTLPKTPQLVSRGDLMRGKRL